MKDNWKWIAGIAINFLIMFVIGYGTYSVLQSDVQNMKEELKEYKLSVISTNQAHIIEQLKSTEKKLDEITKLLMDY